MARLAVVVVEVVAGLVEPPDGDTNIVRKKGT